MTAFLIGVVAYFIGFALGRQAAHTTIADECDKLGGFYVGKRVYKCSREPHE